MKAISLWQPWATLIAIGAKQIETRNWQTKYRGPLAIHAAKRLPERGQIGDYSVHSPARLPKHAPWMLWTAAAHLRRTSAPLPLGCVVATCTLVDVVPMVEDSTRPRTVLPHFAIDASHARLFPAEMPDLGWHPGDEPIDYRDQLDYGDFSPGRYAWILRDIKAVDPPIPARGRQQLWEWSDERAPGGAGG